MLIKADGTGVKPGDTVPVHAGAGGVRLMLFVAASGPVPPVDPRRLNAAGSVYLTRPLRTNFNRTYDEFSWRAKELFDATGGRINITVGERYPLEDAAQTHRDLDGRKTHGSTVLTP